MTGPKNTGVLFAFTSWRVGAVALLSFSSGLPLGLVWIAIPAWLKVVGFDIQTVALITLAQVPWTLKFLWSPLMDRFAPPLLGRRRGWIVLMQVALAAGIALLALQADDAGAKALATSHAVPWTIAAIAMLIAFAAASQDIAIDSYAVEVLHPPEHGPAVGARTAMYRTAMLISGKLAISFSAVPVALFPIAAAGYGWAWTFGLLAVIAALSIPVTIFAPEPAAPPGVPKDLISAVWEPFVGFLQRPRALEILGFVVLYNLSDNLAGALTSPFLIERGYPLIEVGLASGTVGWWATVVGAFIGGFVTQRIGVARALWLFGILQGVSNLGYALLAAVPPNFWIMIAVTAVEAAIIGMCAGAFGVLLIRLTSKRFSATQFALFSSLFALARSFSGPPAGALAVGLGWPLFFLATVPAVLPGLFVLQRFAPFGKKELIDLSGEEAVVLPRGAPYDKGTLVAAGAATAALCVLIGLAASASMVALKLLRTGKTLSRLSLSGADFPLGLLKPVDLVGALAFALVLGVAVPAYMAARGRSAAGGSAVID